MCSGSPPSLKIINLFLGERVPVDQTSKHQGFKVHGHGTAADGLANLIFFCNAFCIITSCTLIFVLYFPSLCYRILWNGFSFTGDFLWMFTICHEGSALTAHHKTIKYVNERNGANKPGNITNKKFSYECHHKKK